MNQAAWHVALECTTASDEERIPFPEVIAKLKAVGMERYRADLVRSEKIYYAADGGSVMTPAHETPRPAGVFSAAGVNAAVRASQAGQIKYREFCARIAAAGCVEYIVSLAGQQAIYFGRTGESHVEPFPQAK
jgi:uncharacterized protein YbcV (DUF1398 family)